MSLNFKETKTAEEYKDLVERFSLLVDKELRIFEQGVKEGKVAEIIPMMPKLISLVNTVGYLRGQDNAFLDYRPHLDFQNDLYKNERDFENRLRCLIESIKSSGLAEGYKRCLSEYFIKTRSS